MSDVGPAQPAAPELDPSLPEELPARTVELLRRGGLAAFVALVVFVATGIAMMLGASVSRLPIDPLFMSIGVAFVVIGVHAAPLAGFATAVGGPAAIGVTLGLALRLLPRMFWHIVVGVMAWGIVASGGVISLGAVARSTGSLGALIAVGAFGVVLLLMAAWIHGATVVGAAHIALGISLAPRHRKGEKLAVGIGGALPFLAVAAVVGTQLDQGARSWTGPEELLLAALGFGLLSAHLVSCALAVAVASRGERGE